MGFLLRKNSKKVLFYRFFEKKQRKACMIQKKAIPLHRF